jgi:uroporphyrinogen decarboxylase
MTSRERVRAALTHREPDRVPFDLGGSCVTGIHARAYARLREALGLPAGEPRVGDIAQQLADVEPDVIEALGCDVRGVSPGGVSTYHREIRDGGECRTFVDEWGEYRRMPLPGGLNHDSYALLIGFAAVHDLQPNVPPENVLAMRSAVLEVAGGA